MNNKTKDDMVDFLASIQKLATALVPFIGFDTATELQATAARLGQSLETDETLFEIR